MTNERAVQAVERIKEICDTQPNQATIEKVSLLIVEWLQEYEALTTEQQKRVRHVLYQRTGAFGKLFRDHFIENEGIVDVLGSLQDFAELKGQFE